jgi:hypothetical protein
MRAPTRPAYIKGVEGLQKFRPDNRVIAGA